MSHHCHHHRCHCYGPVNKKAAFFWAWLLIGGALAAAITNLIIVL